MRAVRRPTAGTVAVVAFAALVVWATVDAVRTPDADRSEGALARTAAERLVEAWERSRTATFVTVGTYERRSEVTGATITSEDVVAQRPPRRLHRQLGGVEGRDDDRLLVCPAPPEGQERREPCRLGPGGGATYEESVAEEVAGMRSLLLGSDPLYSVREPEPGCFELDLRRVEPRAPFGIEARLCFDEATGAPSARRVEHEGGIVETFVATEVRAEVHDDDLEP